MAKKATFRDAQTVARARAARRRAKAATTQPAATEQERTAAEAYRAYATEIEVKMKAIGDNLERHHTEHLANPGDWGLVGDLKHVLGLLNEIIDTTPKAQAHLDPKSGSR